MKIVHRIIVSCFCLFSAEVPECHAQNDPLPPPDYLLETRAGNSLFSGGFATDGYVGHQPANVHLDATGQVEGTTGPLYGYSIQASAEAYGGLRPLAIATAEAHGTPISQSSLVQGSALAQIDYYMRIVARNGADPDAGVPVRIHLILEGSGNASASVRLDYDTYAINIPSGHVSQDFSVTRDIYQGVSVSLRASAIAVDTVGQSPAKPTSSQALADPLFELDQEAFDTMMGANTFNLADFYSFEYSAGLVPEPGTASLMGVGLMVCLRRGRRGVRR